MNKNEFIRCLKERLSNYPEKEVDKAISFYTEGIDDRIEDGMSEEEAVASLGNIDEIIKDIQSDMPINSIVKNKINNQKSSNKSNWILWVLLAIFTFPIWFPLGMALIGIVIAFIATVFGLGIAVIATMFGLSIAGIAVLGYCAVNAITLSPGGIIAMIGLTLIGVGMIIPIGRFALWLFRKIIDCLSSLYRGIKRGLV